MKKILTVITIGLLCFSMFAILAPQVKAEIGWWTTKASLPQAQVAFGATAVNSKIYAIGGQSLDQGQYVWLDTNYEYDPLSDAWTSKAVMPTKRTTLTVVSVNDKVYAIGGAASTSGGAYSTNEEYDSLSNSWTVKAPMPTPRNWISGAVVNGKVYVIGGSDNSGGIFSMNEVYDPLTDTWTTKTSDPQSRLAYGIGVVNNKIYVIGGWIRPGAPLGEPTTLNEEYDPQTDTWTTKTPMPTARNGLGVAVVNNRIYAVGGATDFNPWTDNLNVVEEYDPATDTWRTVQSMPTSRCLLSAAAIGNKLYAIGGWDGTGYLDTNEEFNIPTLGPVGYWKFDEGSGDVAQDSSGYGNNGIIHTATWTTGRIGNALHFNGVDSWVEIPNNPTLTAFSQITLEAWIQEDTVTTQLKGIISKCDGWAPPTNAEYFLGTNDNGRVFFETDHDVAIVGTQTDRLITESGRWYHVAATWSGDSYAVYVDGQPVLTGTCTPQTTLSNTLPVQIGRHGEWSWVYFQGIIDEVKIYNYARTAEEILNDYNSATAPQTTLNINVFDESGFPPASIHGTNMLVDIPIRIYTLDNVLVASGLTDASGTASFSLAEDQYKIVYGSKITEHFGMDSKIVNVYGVSMSLDLYLFQASYHTYSGGGPYELNYIDLDKNSGGYQDAITVQPGQQVNAEFSWWELETVNVPVWCVSAFGSWNPTSALGNLASGIASPSSHNLHTVPLTFTAPNTPGIYEVRLVGVLDYDWPNSYYTAAHYQPSLGRDTGIAVISKTIDGPYGMATILVSSSDVHFESITLNRNPAETTTKGAKIAEGPVIEYYAHMPSLGVWAKAIIENPTFNDFDGTARTYLVDSSAVEHKISSVAIHVAALSESPFYLPIFATFSDPTGIMTIRFEILRGWPSGSIVDEKEMILKIKPTSIPGPKLPAFGNLIELNELLQTDLRYYAYQDVAALLDVLKEISSTAASLMTGMEKLSVGDYLPPMPVSDLATVSSVLSRTNSMGVQVELENRDQGTCTYKATVSYSNWPVYNAFTLEGRQYDFFMWYDRVVTTVKIPPSLTLVNDGSADLKITDGGTTYLLFVDNYVDKMLSYGNTGKHQVEISCPEELNTEIEAKTYFMLGPYYPSAKASDFPINDYNRWNSNPEEVYWVLCAANQAKASVALPWWVEILSGVISEAQTVTSQFVAKTDQALVEFLLTWPGSDLDLHVYDQSGRHVGANYTSGLVDLQIPYSEYYDFGNNTELVRISFPQSGNYTVKVFGKQMDFAEQFTLTTREAPMIKAREISINPQTLNLRSKGHSITVYIELPTGFEVGDINVSSILLNGTIPVDPSAPVTIGDYDSDGIPDLMVKFNRTTAESFIYSQGIRYGNVALTLSGKLLDGTPFKGTDVTFVNYAGDVNNDGKIDILDAAAISAHWYPGPPLGTLGYAAEADLNQDGTINMLDAAIVSANWGNTPN